MQASPRKAPYADYIAVWYMLPSHKEKTLLRLQRGLELRGVSAKKPGFEVLRLACRGWEEQPGSEGLGARAGRHAATRPAAGGVLLQQGAGLSKSTLFFSYLLIPLHYPNVPLTPLVCAIPAPPFHFLL